MAIRTMDRSRHTRLSRRVLLPAALVVLCSAAPDAQYAVTNIDVTLPSGPSQLFGCGATGINDAGDVVGACNDLNRNSASRGFLYDGRQFREIYFPTVQGTAAIAARYLYRNAPFADFRPPHPTVTGIVPQDINIHGQVTGWYGDRTGLRSFLLRNGIVSTISVPGSVYTEALGINDAGKVVGDYRSADGTFHGFLLSNGVFTSFGEDAGATDINNADQIVGCHTLCSRGFLYEGDTFTPIDVPGAVATIPHGINDIGDIVGSYHDGTTLRGFIYDGTNYRTVEVPGAFSTSLFRINNQGHIVGYYVMEPSPLVFEHHAFVARQ
jgi:probable HAF family extracellular repeat protein